jgi:acyl-CoA synthetase (AMP-forming)/AMP-acid ligase II
MQLSHPSYLPLVPGQEVSSSSEVLRFSAVRSPGKVGIIDGDKRWTFAELEEAANRFASSTVDRLSGLPGPIGIMSANSIEYVIAHFGTSRSGRYSVNYPTRCTLSDLVHAMGLTSPAVIFVDSSSEELARKSSEQIENPPLIVPMRHQSGDDFWTFIDSGSIEAPNIDIDPDGPGTVIFTGGTTGRPKAVLSSQRARAISAMAAVEDFRIREECVAGYSVPFTHTAGLFSWFQPAVLAGCTGVIVPKWDPEEFMRLTETHGINVIFAVPSQLATLLDHKAFDARKLRSLEMIAFGGAPLPRSLIERAEVAMPWLECARAYGSTETGHLAAQRRQDRDAVYEGYNNPGGRLEIEIFTEPGKIAETGETGEIATRGAHLMTRYLDDEAAGSSFFRRDDSDGEWGWMGDRAIKHDGYFSIVGRSKHMIISGGLNIYPAELEAILIGHPDVFDCVVFGIADDTWGELPAAAVVVSTDYDDEEGLIDYVSRGVARYKRVRKIFFVPEITRTAAGKARVEQVKEACLKGRV